MFFQFWLFLVFVFFGRFVLSLVGLCAVACVGATWGAQPEQLGQRCSCRQSPVALGEGPEALRRMP